MAGLTLEGEESGVKGGCGTSRSPAVLWTSPLDGNPGRRGLLVQSSSPVGIHHLLQLVVEDKLGVPGRECVLSGLAPTAGPVLWPQTPDHPKVPPAQEHGREYPVCLLEAATVPPGEGLLFTLKYHLSFSFFLVLKRTL